MTRNDVHSPKNLVTEDYTHLYVIDLYPEWPGVNRANLVKKLIIEPGYRYASVHESGQCDHCGARIRYAAWMLHKPTGTVLQVGETCLENRFERASEDFHKVRKLAELDRKRMRIKKLKDAFAVENPDLAWMLTDDIPEVVAWCDFVLDISHKLRLYGELSENQVNAVRKVYNKSVEKAANPEPEEATVSAPDGRVEVSGVVVSTKWQDNDFGGSLKMLVKISEDEGVWKLWTTVPRSLEVERNDEVHIRVTVTPSNDDPSFAFGKRPTVVK